MWGCIERPAPHHSPCLNSCHASNASNLSILRLFSDVLLSKPIRPPQLKSPTWLQVLPCMGLQQGCLTLSTPGAADWLAACSAWLTRQWSSRKSDRKAACLQWQHRTTLQPPYTTFLLYLTPTQSFSGRNLRCSPHTPTNPPYACCSANLSCFLPFFIFQFYEAFLFYWFHTAIAYIYFQYPPIYRFHIGYLQNSPTSHCSFWYTVRITAPTSFQILKLLLQGTFAFKRVPAIRKQLHEIQASNRDSRTPYNEVLPFIPCRTPIGFPLIPDLYRFLFFLSLSFSLFTTYGYRILWTLRGYFPNVSCAPCTGSKIEIIGFRYLEVLYTTDRTVWIRCASTVLIWATRSGRCTQLRAVLASAAPIIIIHAETWSDLPHLGSRISSGRPSSILC